MGKCVNVFCSPKWCNVAQRQITWLKHGHLNEKYIFWGVFQLKRVRKQIYRNMLFMWAYITVYAFKFSLCLWISWARCWKPTAWFLSVYQFGCVSFSSLSHLTPSERCYLCFGFFHHSPRCFFPSYFIFGSDVLVFFLLQLFFFPFTVSFSLFIIPSCFSPHCHFPSLTPSISLAAAAK